MARFGSSLMRSTPGPLTLARSALAASSAVCAAVSDLTASCFCCWPPTAYTPSPRAPATTTKASSATAARRCISMREAAPVTLRALDLRCGSRSWRRQIARWKPLPAALRARVAPAPIAAALDVTVSASGMGDLSGAPASGSAGRTGTSDLDLYVAPTSFASNASAPSLPLPSAATNRACRCSMADCGWSVTSASLRASVPILATMFADTRHSESPTESSPRQTSGSRASTGRPRSRLGSGSVDSRAWRMR